MQPEVDHLLDVARCKHRHIEARQHEIRVAGVDGGTRVRVVSRDGQHAAVPAYAAKVGVVQGVGGAVDAGRLAVPHAEHAVVLGAGHRVQRLGAEHRCRRQFLVQAGMKNDVVFVQMLPVAQHLVVHPADRRARVAADIAGRVQPVAHIQPSLVEHQPQQGLHAVEVDRSLFDGIAVIQRQQVLEVCHGIHGKLPGRVSAMLRTWRRRGIVRNDENDPRARCPAPGGPKGRARRRRPGAATGAARTRAPRHACECRGRRGGYRPPPGRLPARPPVPGPTSSPFAPA